jgi:transcriptional regulator with XRE-family HTH domain
MGDEALAERFGGLVRRLRVEKGYSQEEFSFRVGLHQTYVSSVERGERNVTIRTADRIARALGTTLSSMFSELEQGWDASDDG